MLIKLAPASVASALARRVFPVPGGPKSKIPLQGWKSSFPWSDTYLSIEQTLEKIRINTRNKFPREKSSGLLIGRMTSSFNALFTSSRAPISSNLTPISPGGTTAETKLLSYSSFARFCSNLYMLKVKQDQIKAKILTSFLLLGNQMHAFRFWDGFRDKVSCSFKREIATSRLHRSNKTDKHQSNETCAYNILLM